MYALCMYAEPLWHELVTSLVQQLAKLRAGLRVQWLINACGDTCGRLLE